MGTHYPERIPLALQDRYAVSMAEVARTGALRNGTPQGTMMFDEKGNDTFATEFRAMRDALIARVEGDPKIQEATRAGNQAGYEERLAEMTSDAMAASKQFGQQRYRSAGVDYPNVSGAGRYLNDLDKKAEYDCEGMSYVKGLLLHHADSALVASGKRTEPTAFYITNGSVSGQPQDLLGGHQFLISARTGNIIEGTQDEGSYQRTHIGFVEHIAGFPSNTTKRDTVYTQHLWGMNDEGAIKRLVSLINHPQDAAALESLWFETGDRINERQKAMASVAVAIEDGSVIQTGSGGLLVSEYLTERKPDSLRDVLEEAIGPSLKQQQNGVVTATMLARDRDAIEAMVKKAHEQAAHERHSGMEEAKKQALKLHCQWVQRTGANACELAPMAEVQATPSALPGERGPSR